MRKTIVLFLLIATGQLKGQVSLQTGSANFSIPVFSWQDDKSRLNGMVAMSYSSGNGLRVNDVASNVGQGWSLIAGGVISRMQVGQPDDQVGENGNNQTDDIRKYPNGILFAVKPAYEGCPTALTKYPIYGHKNQVYSQHNAIAEDRELDYFSFQFNGKAGMFVLDPTNPGHVHSLGDTKIKISFQLDANLQNQGIRTRITSFTIQDVDGLKYKFARHGLSKVLQSNYCDENLNLQQNQPKFENGKVYHQYGFENSTYLRPNIITSWYLSEVEDPFTQRKVQFNYTTRTIISRAGQDLSHTDNNDGDDYAIIYHRKSVTQTPVLTSIVYPDGHTVTLNYGADRFDLPGDKMVSSIDVTYNGRYLSKHELKLTYIILNRYGTPVTDYQKRVARLYLKSVRKIGPDLKEDSAPYIFEYNLGSSAADDFVPPPFYYAKDIWGFYNGDNSKNYSNGNIDLSKPVTKLSYNEIRGLCFRRSGSNNVVLNAKSGYARNGLLKQIIFPTGGTLSYEYAQNTGVLGGSTTSVGGVHVANTKSTDGGYSNDCNNPLVSEYHYVLSGDSSSLWGLEMPVNSVETESHYQPEHKFYKLWGCFPIGCCDWKYKYPGILSQQQSTDLSGIMRLLETLGPALNILNVLSTISDISTALSGNPAGLIISVIVGIIQLAITCFGSQARNRSAIVYYNYDMNGASPLPNQFKRVEVRESPSGIGKTVHDFTSSDDYAIWFPSNPNFAARQRYASWAYGLPKLLTVYNASGEKVKETQNNYSFSNAKRTINYCDQTGGHGGPCNSSGLSTSLVSCNCIVTKSSSQRNTDWGNPTLYTADYKLASDNTMKVTFYGMFTGRVELTSTYERNYKPGNPSQYLESSRTFVYNYDNYEVNQVMSTGANGETRKKFIKYTTDYPGSSGELAALRQQNLVSTPVAVSEAVYDYVNSTWQDQFLSEEVTEFTTLSTGDIRPVRILQQRFEKPRLSYNPSGPVYNGYFGPGHSSNPTYAEVQTFAYDASGNLIYQKDESDRIVSNIFDYSDKYVVASVVNAHLVNDKPAYSSFETSALGGWTLTGSSAVYVTSSAVTGTRSMSLGANSTLTRTLNTAKAYILSFWATNGNTSVTGGATLVKSAPTYNGFTYYEYSIAQGTGTVTVSGNNSIIDELRLYPQTARMRTVTYDPVLGKTAECDENNRITYYEYDNLGRLRFTRDEKLNIVKMYEYNNVSTAKQNGCPGTYYNRRVAEIFTRNNCSSNYLGGEVEYVIAANTYSSSISLEDADAKAEAALLTSGQSYANSNGSCTQLYFNTVQSQTFTTEGCPLGQTGGSVVYTVPANTYSSTISQADANQKALDDITANGEYYANNAPNRNCVNNYAAVWEWLPGSPTYCLSVNGNLPPNLFVLMTDINPNSSTYNQTQWEDVGPQEVCPSNTYYNAQQSGNFTRNNCGGGYNGTTVNYIVPPGTYSSTVSQAAANQLAINDLNANGQSYANANGSCVPAPNLVNLYYSNYTGGGILYVTMTNTSTYQQYFFEMNSYYYPYMYLGTVDEGNYDIEISDSYGYTYRYYEAGCSNYTAGYTANFYNISINDYCPNIIVQ